MDCAWLVFSGGADWSDFALRFFLPTLLGNIAGGVAMLAYGQIAPEIAKGP